MKSLLDIAGILKRSKNLDKKNGMFVYLLNKLTKIESVVELYGGYGMQTFYIRKHFPTILHTIYEIDPIRFQYLDNHFSGDTLYKHNKSCETDLSHVYNQFELCISDGYCLTKKTFDHDVELMKKTGAKYFIVTNTGIFHAKFEAGGYGGNIQNTMTSLMSCGLNTISTVYAGNYGLMLLTTLPVNNSEIRRYTKELADNSWKEVFCDKNSIVGDKDASIS